MQMPRSTDKRDLSMLQAGEMLYCLLDAITIVHAQQADSRPFGADIDKHQWHLALGQLFKQRLFHPERHHRDSLSAALEHATDAQRHALGVVVRRTDQNLVSVFDRN